MNWRTRGRIVAVATIALLLVPFGGARTPAVADAPSRVVWNGVELGVAVSGLRYALGDPLSITPDPTEPEARYWIPGSDSTFFLVLEERGYVRGIDAFVEATPTAPVANVPPDPSGVHLGDTMQTVKQLHPNFSTGSDHGQPVIFGTGPLPNSIVVYEFDQGHVHSFDWQMKLPAGAPTLPPISESDGTSIANAILDVQANESFGMHWEDLFIAYQPPCDTQTQWQRTGQGIVWNQGHPFDVDHVVCPTTKTKRDFYFDISNFFGRN
jgi:hypothetical protein